MAIPNWARREWAKEVLSTTSVTITFGNLKIEKKPLYTFNSYTAPAILTPSPPRSASDDTDDDDDARD